MKLVIAAALALLVCAPGATAAVSFGTASPYPTGDTLLIGVATVDTDRDGIVDVVTAGQSLNRLPGLGGGAFGPAVAVNGLQPGRSVLARRLDGDRVRDLAVINDDFDPARVSILIGRRNGSFRQPNTYRAGNSALQLASGDFDGDGKLDLLASSNDNDRLVALFGRGNGTFEKAKRIDVGSSTNSIDSGDFNRDGRADFAANNGGVDATISIGYGRGNRSFRQPADLDAGLNPFALDVADVDGNRRPDVAVTHPVQPGNDFVSVLFRNRQEFAAPVTLPLGADTTPQSLTVADLNGDGLRELAVGNYGGSVSVFENTGARTFASPIAYPVGDGPQAVAAAKLDDDGLRDLVTANDNSDDISVLINGL